MKIYITILFLLINITLFAQNLTVELPVSKTSAVTKFDKEIFQGALQSAFNKQLIGNLKDAEDYVCTSELSIKNGMYLINAKLSNTNKTVHISNSINVNNLTKLTIICSNIVQKLLSEIRTTLAVEQNLKTFSDSRDGKVYTTVTIGNKTWMAENLNYNMPGSFCYAADEYYSTKMYGRLYQFEQAKNACPTGWHLPSKNEWISLVDFAGGKNIAAQKLKSTSGWINKGNGENTYGFNLKASGLRNKYDDSDPYNTWGPSEYTGEGEKTIFYTSTEVSGQWLLTTRSWEPYEDLAKEFKLTDNFNDLPNTMVANDNFPFQYIGKETKLIWMLSITNSSNKVSFYKSHYEFAFPVRCVKD